MRCHSCANKKTPADCLVSPQFNLDQFNLDLNLQKEDLTQDDKYEFYKFSYLHESSQLSCLAECFLMDGHWCNLRLPSPDVKGPHIIGGPIPDLLSFANNDESGILYDTFAQARFLENKYKKVPKPKL